MKHATILDDLWAKEMQKVISQELEQYHRRGGYPDTVTGE